MKQQERELLSDEQIIDLYFAREERAITETDNKYRGYLHTVANNILANEQDAQGTLFAQSLMGKLCVHFAVFIQNVIIKIPKQSEKPFLFHTLIPSFSKHARNSLLITASSLLTVDVLQPSRPAICETV